MNIFRDAVVAAPGSPEQIQQIANLAQRIAVDFDDLWAMVRELPEEIVPITEEDQDDFYALDQHKNSVAAALLPAEEAHRRVCNAYMAWRSVRSTIFRNGQSLEWSRKQRTGPIG